MLLAIAPAVFMGLFILQYGVDVPYWDQWGVARLLVKQAEGDLSIQDLLAQHNEHRIFFPKLVFLALATLTNWNVKYEMLFILLLACIASLSVYFLFRRTVTQNLILSFFLTFLSNVLIFSPIQYKCWLWGFQITFLMPIVCLVLSLLITQLKVNFWVRLLLCIVLATVSTFSVAAGALSWLVLLPVILLSAEGVKRKTLFSAVIPIWLICFSLNIAAYLSGYQSSVSSSTANKSSIVLSYPFAFLGSPLGVGNPAFAIVAGYVLVALYVFACLYTVLHWRKFLKQAFVWLALGAYSILSAMMATLARSGSGVEQALSSRYTTISIYLVIAVIALLAIVSKDIKENKFYGLWQLSEQTSRDILHNSLTCLIAICFSLNLATSIDASSAVTSVQRDRLFAKTCLTFIRFVPNNCITQYLNPGPPRLIKQFAQDLNKAGFLSPPIVKVNNIAALAPATSRESAAYGEFLSVTPKGRNTFDASGWAALPQHHKPADSVLITYRNAAQRSVLLAIASVRHPTPAVANALRDDRYRYAGWSTSFPIRRLPKQQDLVIEAWAFDTDRSQAFRITQQHILRRG
ncbi:hypothetical protein [Leptolyngbya sp. FACHB-711]|uniref:hypothetical protein n=1 Tax=unclassified Leptolyngbya TaxID=2650499 RepID=UPI0019C61879|nr:hypothetical protein [Leptolyngbya sp. FACHB-711]MBD2027068.1 hypothetical protein [Leptolyngbya sp. FACHB-711]